MTMLPADYHIHSHHSGDCDSPMKDVIEAAVSRKLPAMCFTEHMDMDYPDLPDIKKGQFELDTDAYFSEHQKLADEYKDMIPVRFGVELGLQPQIVDFNADYVKKYPFDFVIASTHVCHGQDPYYPEFYENRTEKEAFSFFFKTTLENIQDFDDFDVYGHLDYVVRYAPNGDKNFRYEDHKEIIDEILSLLISKNKGLDVNTKSLYSSSLSQPNPCKDILCRYKKLGGKIITFGSDAHKSTDVSREFEKAVEIASSAGFDRYCQFIKREPVFFDL
ncbi:histidinol-phosphatase HisJ family protein [Butyrivibrio sp. NC2002]|uniref:histidinol-phosphatase HisJ family protein n=1 Tax=Butyrivibrio sp. NC2002 TaxID=1410610 RepID=UPI000AD8749E|nr:histidinol-phosphatase HisJ family protein [Butyrivibrio sp. NC2002]